MGLIGNILGTPLGYIMKLCYDVINNFDKGNFISDFFNGSEKLY